MRKGVAFKIITVLLTTALFFSSCQMSDFKESLSENLSDALENISELAMEESESADTFFLGFAKAAPEIDLENESYYMAGYRNGLKPTEIRDLPEVKGIVLSDNLDSEMIALVSVDCIGLSSGDIEDIKKRFGKEFTEISPENIFIFSTHDHASLDTLGLWGEPGKAGKNENYLRLLKETVFKVIKEAYADRSEGVLSFGSYLTADRILEDTRQPEVFDSHIYSFRFSPLLRGKKEVRILNFASHAESLKDDNTAISADFPGVVSKLLLEKDYTESVWIPGAIGGLIRTKDFSDNPEESCRKTGEAIYRAIHSISNEKILYGTVSAKTVKFETKVENPYFIAMQFLGNLNYRGRSRFGLLSIETETSLLEIGGQKICCIPGEIFPELCYESNIVFQPLNPGEKLPTLSEVLGNDILIFGLCNDEIGYIVPPEDYYLSSEAPYLKTEKDGKSENHYEETNSISRGIYNDLLNAVRKLE